jgi:hypothetical protein
MALKYIKWWSIRSNAHKINRDLPLQDRPKCTQIAIVGLKINHLATLVRQLRLIFRFSTWTEPFFHICRVLWKV